MSGNKGGAEVMKDGVGLRAATFILVLLLALGVMCGTNMHRAYAAGPTASILSEDNLSANAGSTVVVPINISGNPGIMGMGLTVGYDSDVLTPVSVESASLTSEGQFDDSIEASFAGSFSIEWAHSENITGNGTLFNVTFQVSEYAEGDTTVSLGFIKKDTFNEDFDDVTLACSPAVISITSTSSTSTTVRGGANLSANDGSEIEIPILIDNMSGVESLDFALSYDAAVFTYESVAAGVGATCEVTASEDGCSVGVSGIDTETASGTLLTLRFKVADYAGGNYVFGLTSDDVSTRDFRVKIINTHSNENAIVTSGAVELSGTELTIPVRITNNHGIAGFRFTMTYDGAALEPVSVTKSGALTGSLNNTIGDAIGSFDVLWTGTDNYYENGVLYTAKFNVLSSADASTIIRMQYSPADTCDEEGKDVLLTMSDIEVELAPAPAPALESISASKANTAYTVGDELDVSDVTVTAAYSDGSSRAVEGWESNAAQVDMSTAGSKALAISYSEGGVTKTCELVITVEPAPAPVPTLSSIKAYKDKKTYTVGDELDVSDVTVIATYSDDSIAVVSGWISDANLVDMSSAGIRAITVAYTEGDKTVTCSIEITVEPAPAPVPTLSSIKAFKDKTTYIVGDELDFFDVTVLATYSDGSSKAVEDWTSDAASVDMSTAGTKSITISYAESDISVTCAISIIVEAMPEPEVVLSSISAVKAKTDYQVNDELGIDDVVVTASYSDGTSKTVEGWQIDVASVDMSTVGTKALVITYAEGKVTVACSVSVNVEAPSVVRTLSHILATKAKTAYTVGDELAVDDVIVTAAYSDGSTVQVTGWTSDEATIDMTSVGTKVLTIAYTEDGISVNCTISITVSAPPEAETTLMSISASKEKTVYTMGDDLSVDDVVVTAVYSDGSSKTVTDWVSNVETVDMSTAGVKSIAIAYTEREITVICAVTISVEAAPQPDPLLTSISASKGKVAYRVGDVLNIDDIIVTATYSDGSSKAVEGWQSDVASIDMATEGAKTLTIIYIEGDIARTCTIEITVKEDGQEEAGLAYIYAEQNEVTLFVGDELDLSGVKIMACYFNRDDDVQISLEDCVVDASEVDMSEPGCYFVEVAYAEGGVSDCVYITVNVRADIKAFDAKVKIDTTNSDMYLFGLPAMPKVSIDGLTEGEDYEVSYSDNTNAGEGKVIITGLEPYGGTIVKSFTIAPAHVFLMVPGIKQSSAVYTGKAHKPHVTFAFPGLVQERDYKLTYKNNVNIGEASVVVTGLGNYAGNYELYFDILPAKAAIGKAKSEKAKTIKVVPKKQPGGVKYQVGYRLGKKGVWKYKTIKKKSITLKKLKKRKKYQVRIRAFKKVGGETYYGAWSKIKNVKVR